VLFVHNNEMSIGSNITFTRFPNGNKQDQTYYLRYNRYVTKQGKLFERIGRKASDLKGIICVLNNKPHGSGVADGLKKVLS
jgi:hypothetical protein